MVNEALPAQPRPDRRRLNVALVGEPTRSARKALARLPPAVSILDTRTVAPDDLAAAEAVLIWDFRWRSVGSLLQEMPGLRWIHTASAGVDHILSPVIRDAGIVVSNSAGIFDRPIGEYVLALVLAHAKGLVKTIDAQRERRWVYRETRGIDGSVMAVVGLGRVGRAVAELASAAGMVVIGVSNTASRVAGIDVVPHHQMTDALKQADYVVVTTALTPDTLGLIGRAEIAAMKPSAYLINVARGPIVDTDALVDALNRETIAGAALDVFDEEPLPADSPLWGVPSLLVSPHMAGDADGWDVQIVALFAENVRRFLAEQPLLNVVDHARGY